ncbi:transposase [Nonomuraea deserti]|uniref:Transposase n=1 Tax=Nonomuraea deserti TaxID=1848322 RepID=A0A4R4VQH7_9ACTN|nr:transposase [Nonomuraea deserti]TDD05383.1 transposase [Nonomuraea deserti]
MLLLLALPWTVPAGFVTGALLLTVFTAGISVVLRRRRTVTCQCFGASTAPVGTVHVIRLAPGVPAALTSERNSGRVEGNVNRIKRIKRDGYVRANVDLLRLQLLHADKQPSMTTSQQSGQNRSPLQVSGDSRRQGDGVMIEEQPGDQVAA